MTQTNWSEDGVFKIPPLKPTKQDLEYEATIARRTRSKLCLSETPLEVIEEAFIPPDITTDMYDMECDNDDWKDFLKKFTRPLDEVAKPTEDEDCDPEYNILADEDNEELDREELRMDKAVKITKKELNNLIAELFEFATSWPNNDESNNNEDNTNEESTTLSEDNVGKVPVVSKTVLTIPQENNCLRINEQETAKHISVDSLEEETGILEVSFIFVKVIQAMLYT